MPHTVNPMESHTIENLHSKMQPKATAIVLPAANCYRHYIKYPVLKETWPPSFRSWYTKHASSRLSYPYISCTFKGSSLLFSALNCSFSVPLDKGQLARALSAPSFTWKGEAIDNACAAGKDRVRKVRQADEYVIAPLSPLESPREKINEHGHDLQCNHGDTKNYYPHSKVGSDESVFAFHVLHIVSYWVVAPLTQHFPRHTHNCVISRLRFTNKLNNTQSSTRQLKRIRLSSHLTRACPTICTHHSDQHSLQERNVWRLSWGI